MRRHGKLRTALFAAAVPLALAACQGTTESWVAPEDAFALVELQFES